jgi:Zn-dependent peptidase ImmA (M78 family)
MVGSFLFVYLYNMTKNDKYLLLKFVKFVQDELGITDPFKIKISNNRDGFKTYAYYNPQDKIVAVYTENRALADIMRSMAHELVHHFDHQTGLAQKKQNPDIGVINNDEEKSIDASDIENRANAIAGILIKKFGYEHPAEDLWNSGR